ncbi:Phytoene dehydrogenase [Candidatus Portiera aleyrodidarum]|uniref:Phytoene dehydrogenase n=1 Tax=Candidatus Portiera aleyrodidarum TV TaxID=1297582 RepID=A0A8D3XAV5_9GAMM|nr:phytoene desaturase family protein [Candidatus Portiera aleyrodidarum]AGI27206.1 phytoene desaturase [Candidatus Portiera aleyrodidarum TV]CEI59191.1 Phytoene dehydrogenase [Candidatus Portiera aleyrodidarum]
MKNIIVIIGSGLGGIAAALRAKKKGFDVIIIERNKNIGGKAQIYKDKTFFFDTGPTIITAPYLFEELFNIFGKKLPQYINFIELNHWYNFYFFDKTTFNYCNNVKKTKHNIKFFSKTDLESYNKLLLITKRFFEFCFKRFSKKTFNTIYHLIKCIPTFIKLKCYHSYFYLINHFIKNNKLKQIFSIYPLLIGGNPYKVSCLYSLILYLERKWGIHFPQGGIGYLINKLEMLMREEGIKIYTGVSVKKIITHKNKAISIILNNNYYINTNFIISNIEPRYLYKNLIKMKNNLFIKKKLSKFEYSIGLFILYFGTNCFYSNISHHTIFFNKTYNKSIKNMFYTNCFNKKNICIYVHHPTITDHFCKHSTFYALIPVPNLKLYNNWSMYESEKLVQSIISILDSTLLPKLKKNIITCFYITPNFFKERYFSTYGSGFSLSPNFNQIAWFRFHNKSETINNLYLVGAGTHPGAGIPGVLLSAKIIDNLII